MDGFKRIMERTDERISEPKDRRTEITTLNNEKKLIFRKMNRILRTTTKSLIVVSTESWTERKNRAEKVFEEIVTVKFPNLAKQTSKQTKRLINNARN